ncbi:protein DJ-1 homolog C isoform X2 [Nymphaea colorata]|uniref:protein DJ-1 homolog C isoform X2 n=1 Tax=Nymphaea colorata TaxID=210225 RepID=UPI00129DC631|nr:protein DJ-1 homolog C isoform X2 [Nymphaea colorata]
MAILALQPFSAFPFSRLHPSSVRPMAAGLVAVKPTAPSSTLITSPLKKVLVPIGLGTEEMEAAILIDILRRAGARVTLASVEPQMEVKASWGVTLVADALISACELEVFDLVVLPGGMPGSARLRDCQVLEKIVRKHAEEKRLYGAICAAPAIALQAWGLLKKKKVTGHPAFLDKLPTFWRVKSNVQVSGEVTTSRGPGTAVEFALSLVEQIFGQDLAQEIGGTLVSCGDDFHQRSEEYNSVEWSSSHTPRALVPIANGSAEMETIVVVDILRRAHVDVVVASVERSKQIVACRGTKIIADKLIGDAAESNYDLIILPGGCNRGERLHKSRVLKKLLQEQDSAGKVYGEICSSTVVVLEKQGLFKDRMVSEQQSMTGNFTGQVAKGAGVVIDGNLITGSGPGNAINFSLVIVGKLFGHARARSVAEGIVSEYSECQVNST